MVAIGVLLPIYNTEFPFTFSYITLILATFKKAAGNNEIKETSSFFTLLNFILH